MLKTQNVMLKTQNEMSTSQDEMKGSIQKNTDGILRIELVHGKKIDLLLDGYKSHEEKLDYVIQELSANNAKWDRYELEILSMKKKIAR